MMKTLFLQPPSFDGFDGGAGSRYQARREIKSFWFPTWLAQPAALIPGSTLIDAPPANIGMDRVLEAAKQNELCIIHTSTPSFTKDVKVAAIFRNSRFRCPADSAPLLLHRRLRATTSGRALRTTTFLFR